MTDETKVLSDIWNEGFDAYFDGMPSSPEIPLGIVEHANWRAGWTTALAYKRALKFKLGPNHD